MKFSEKHLQPVVKPIIQMFWTILQQLEVISDVMCIKNCTYDPKSVEEIRLEKKSLKNIEMFPFT